MKAMKQLLPFVVAFITQSTILAQSPPYFGTIFIDPNIIKSTDPTTFVSSTYTRSIIHRKGLKRLGGF
jgi:hypothetical protein